MVRFLRITGAAVILLASAMTPMAWADDAARPVTFTKDVLPILQENCQTCHRPATIGVSGMVAPMALTTYEEVRPWAKSIVKAIESGKMPPWSASREFRGVFKNERYLTDEEIDTIARWVNSGAPMGRAEDAPPPRLFPQREWWLGEPDVIVRLPEPVWVGDEVEDWQPMYQIPLTEDVLPEDRWLRGMECVPDSNVVHHIVVYAYGQGMDRDRGNVGVGGNLGGLAPGAEPEVADEGYGYLLKKGTTLAVSMHYHKETGPGTGAWDQSRIGLFFYPKDAKARNVQISPVGNMTFEIPPGVDRWEVGMARTFERPVTVLGLLPHMHFRGAAARYVAIYPDGRRETLLDVPNYDYAWQHNYRFQEARRLPVGTRLEVRMWFDNSPANPANPDPTKAVRFGGPTTDEMALGWMYFTFDDEAPTVAAIAGQR